MHNKTIFISDMHFSKKTTYFNQLLHNKLKEWQGNIDALYLLGDIFDGWIGDDDNSRHILEISNDLYEFSKKTKLFIMRGNRDFLINNTFARKINAILLDDPYLVDIYGNEYILTHGDIMCTDDITYQKFRIKVTNPLWQEKVLNRPLWMRKSLATFIKIISRLKKKNKNNLVFTDVTQDGIDFIQDKFINISPNPKTIIHGHTHKPSILEEEYQGKKFTRVVIPDWRPNQCGCVEVRGNNIILSYF